MAFSSLRRCGRSGLALLFTMLVIATPSACDSSRDRPSGDSPISGSYVGTAEGTGAYIAIVVGGTRATAYLCDGIPGEGGNPPTIQAWFTGTLDGHTANLTTSGKRLQVQFAESTFTGRVNLGDGRDLRVSGNLAHGDAGLYRAESREGTPEGVAGWIVAADGTQWGGTTGFSSGTVVATFSLTKLSLSIAPTTTTASAPIVVSKNIQGLVPSPLTAEDFASVSKN